MSTFHCADCEQDKPVQTNGGTGYAVLNGGAADSGKVCYECAALRDIAQSKTGHVVAYVGKALNDGMGVYRTRNTRYELTTWAGIKIGTCALSSSWRTPRSYVSDRMYQIYATIDGKDFTGRGAGKGMSVVLRETAASKRKGA